MTTFVELFCSPVYLYIVQRRRLRFELTVVTPPPPFQCTFVLGIRNYRFLEQCPSSAGLLHLDRSLLWVLHGELLGSVHDTLPSRSWWTAGCEGEMVELYYPVSVRSVCILYVGKQLFSILSQLNILSQLYLLRVQLSFHLGLNMVAFWCCCWIVQFFNQTPFRLLVITTQRDNGLLKIFPVLWNISELKHQQPCIRGRGTAHPHLESIAD